MSRKPGNMPRSDYGIFLVVSMNREPLMLVEYKQQTDSDLGSVTTTDLAQVYLQGYYMLKKNFIIACCV